ncbi:hypothetical protein PsorP6_005713 [Peronosclerospora sorghi]|uniref:Uncharacterized protein n=1 Tax=Peronosclerospora sorghi TaxID=230839 RepID=A0ACC0W7K1_9STRA|nr:hypothetical protein PsorP6_005713 [Peronosclerospora sorghi]
MDKCHEVTSLTTITSIHASRTTSALDGTSYTLTGSAHLVNVIADDYLAGAIEDFKTHKRRRVVSSIRRLELPPT